MASRNVFLSSTSKGLLGHREAAYHAIEGLDGHHCVGMEDFGARVSAAVGGCRARVAEWDLLVCVLGLGYGSRPEGIAHPGSEGEYRAAVAEHKPVLVCLLAQLSWADEPG